MNESFEGQLVINGIFKSIKPSTGDPYRYETELKAVQMVKSCYPDYTRLAYLIKAKKVNFPVNMRS